MAAGDVDTYGPTTPKEIGALLTAGTIVVADDITMCSVGGGQVFVVVIKAA